MSRFLVALVALVASCAPEPVPPPSGQDAGVVCEVSTLSETTGSPAQMAATDEPSHTEACEDDAWNVTGTAACSTEARISPRCGATPSADGECTSDADCGSRQYCGAISESDACSCFPEPCAETSDCGADQICVCASVLGVDFMSIGVLQHKCVVAECEGPEDCGGRECGIDFRPPCEEPVGAFCRTTEDECHGHEDCDVGLCRFDTAEGYWRCDGSRNSCD